MILRSSDGGLVSVGAWEYICLDLWHILDIWNNRHLLYMFQS